jgi:hypothetical protein
MCGGANFLEDFDLTEFCSILQELVPNVQVVPATKAPEREVASKPRLVSEAAFEEAMGKYCHR